MSGCLLTNDMRCTPFPPGCPFTGPRKLGTVSGPGRRPLHRSARLGWLLVCLPGSPRDCGSRRHSGGRAARLWLVQTAPEDVAHQDGRDHGTHHDQYPAVPHEVLVNHHRRGGCGERSQGAPGGIVHRVRDGGRPHAARVDSEVAKDKAAGHDAPHEQGQDDQPVARGMVERGEEDQGHVPRCPDKTNQHQGARLTPTQELRKQIASPSEFFSKDECEREQDDLYEEAEEPSAGADPGHDEGGERGGPHDGRGDEAHEQRRPKRDPPDAQAQTVEAQRLPALLEEPSRVTTSSMIKAATVGVNMYTAAPTNSEAMPSALITKAATRAMHSTRTEKMAALLVSVSFVNMTQTFPLAEEPARRSCLAAGSYTKSV